MVKIHLLFRIIPLIQWSVMFCRPCYIDFPHNNNQACKVLWQDGWVGRKQYVSLRRRGNKTSHLYLNKCGHWSVHGWRKPNMVDWCGGKVDEKVFFVTIYATLKTHKNHDITLFDSSLVFRFKLFLHGYRLLTLANLCMYILTISGSGHSNFLITSEHWFNCVNTSTTDEENNACSALFWNCKQKKISLE